ncbi:MAG: L-2-hydroxyglutarate oxidase, partial [Rhodothermales bacterium]|nr:L-2-hydroxyglutarate oxidase [Rhodothermales bacterium]
MRVAVVGGGIVGLATAYRLTQRFPRCGVVVLEKEGRVAQHQTGRNSGVVHSGVYYQPGSAKARTCRAGRAALLQFCDDGGVPYRLSGKVIVAVHRDERERLAAIERRGRANGVVVHHLGPEALSEREPHVRGLAALLVPEAGVVDYGAVAHRLAERTEEAGGAVRTGAELRALHRRPDGLTLETTAGEVRADRLVNCAGLHSDRVARLCGDRPPVQIVPFRGEYYALRPEARGLCRALVYPVPDPAFPFLGVHFTRHLDGSVTCGPSAVLAFAREGYRKADVSVRDLADTLTHGGFLRLAARHWRVGLGEFHRSLDKGAFVRA